MGNFWLLWRQILRHPRELGTVAPSSRWLAKGLIKASELSEELVIVEVGAGTGPLTHWIRAAAPKAQFFTMEPNTDMAMALRERFLGLDVCEQKVEALPQALAKRGYKKANRILSSIPWSIFPLKDMFHSIDAICESLSDDGYFVTLVYIHSKHFPSSIKFKELLEEKFKYVEYSKPIWRNIPPGHWLVCRYPIRQPIE